MNLPDSVNIITILIACFFIIPIVSGVVRPFSSGRVERSMASLMDNVALLVSIILSIYITRLILSDSQNVILTTLYKVFPALKSMVAAKEFWVYVLFILVFLFIIDGLLHLITIPVYRYAIVPAAGRISARVNAMKSVSRRIIGGLWQLPKSIWIVLVFSILLSLFISFWGDPFMAEYAQRSAPYRLVQENVVQPLLNTGAAKNIQVILNDSFKAAQSELAGQKGKFRLIQYFNGVTIDQAVQSNAEIDAMAQKVTEPGKNDKEKAYLLYKWIAGNVSYDDAKAAILAKDPSGVSSGAVVAFNTRTGVCFDYSALYVAMSRAAGLKVRFITGLGYNGTKWGDHAWNQVYDSKSDVWINVDTTFGSTGINYFNRPYFDLDHANAEVQGEWE